MKDNRDNRDYRDYRDHRDHRYHRDHLKILYTSGKSPYQKYDYTPYLPTDGKPGKWLPEIEGLPAICANGYHDTNWLQLPIIFEVLSVNNDSFNVYYVEVEGSTQGRGKSAHRRMRLLSLAGKMTRGKWVKYVTAKRLLFSECNELLSDARISFNQALVAANNKFDEVIIPAQDEYNRNILDANSAYETTVGAAWSAFCDAVQSASYDTAIEAVVVKKREFGDTLLRSLEARRVKTAIANRVMADKKVEARIAYDSIRIPAEKAYADAERISAGLINIKLAQILWGILTAAKTPKPSNKEK